MDVRTSKGIKNAQEYPREIFATASYFPPTHGTFVTCVKFQKSQNMFL